MHNPNSKAVDHNSISENDSQAANPLDPLSAADIAVNAGRMINIDEITAVTNQADSVAAELNTQVVSYAVVPKPQILSSTATTKTKADIKEYTTVQGDTYADLASRFGVTSDSIKWSNGLTGSILRAGTKLVIPPVDGIVYTVKDGDTAESLASKYSANKDQIIAFNDAEVKGLVLGDRIVVPGGSIPAPTVTYSSYSGFSFGTSALYGANGYDYGWCTWYVASKISVPRNWGNANTWDNGAAASGWTVSSVPVVGAIAQRDWPGLGHVAIVEAVSEDGSMIKYSDMNGLAGWGQVGYSDWVSKGVYQRYLYR